MLLTAIATDPATPAVALTAIADTLLTAPTSNGRTGKTGGPRLVVLGHPNLPGDHPALGHVTWNDLDRALASPLVTDARAQQLFAHTTTADHRTYLALHHPAHRAAYAPVPDPQTGAMPALIAAQILLHPYAPADAVLHALHALVGARDCSAQQREAILTAATRHPQHLASLSAMSADLELRGALARYASMPDPHRFHLATVIRTATRDATRWASILTSACDLSVARAALTRNPSRDVWSAVLNSRLPQEDKLTLLRQFAHADTPIGTADVDVLIATAQGAPEADLIRFVTMGVLGRDFASHVLDRADLAPHTLAFLADHVMGGPAKGAHSLSRPATFQGARAVAAAELAINASAAPGQRQAADELVARDRALFARDYATTLRTLTTAGLALNTFPPEVVGAHLPVALLRSEGIEDLSPRAIGNLIRAALTAHHDDLARPGYTQALVALEPSFTGTLGDLLATARGIAG